MERLAQWQQCILLGIHIGQHWPDFTVNRDTQLLQVNVPYPQMVRVSDEVRGTFTPGEVRHPDDIAHTIYDVQQHPLHMPDGQVVFVGCSPEANTITLNFTETTVAQQQRDFLSRG